MIVAVNLAVLKYFRTLSLIFLNYKEGDQKYTAIKITNEVMDPKNKKGFVHSNSSTKKSFGCKHLLATVTRLFLFHFGLMTDGVLCIVCRERTWIYLSSLTACDNNTRGYLCRWAVITVAPGLMKGDVRVCQYMSKYVFLQNRWSHNTGKKKKLCNHSDSELDYLLYIKLLYIILYYIVLYYIVFS